MHLLRHALIIAACLLLLPGCEKKIELDVEAPDIKAIPEITAPIDVSSPDADANLPEVFSRLDRQFSKNNIHSLPPIAESEINALEQQLPCKLPPVLRAMYRWHNGIPDFIPMYELLPLDKMVEQYKLIRRIDKEVGWQEGEGWPVHFLPILQFDGKEHIALDCKNTGSAGSKALYHYFVEDGTPTARYRGPAHLLQVSLSAYESQAYWRRFDRMEIDPIAEAKAFRQHATASELQIMEDNWTKIEPVLTSAKGINFRIARSLLSRVADERAIPVLLARIPNADPEEIVDICIGLANFKAEAARPALNDLLKHKVPRARQFAANALSELSGPQSDAETTALLALLDDSDKQVQVSAIEALKLASSYRAIDALIDKLHHSKPGIQAYIVVTLADIGDRRALPALHELQASLPAQMDNKIRIGTRGSDPSPAEFKRQVDEAIKQLSRN